jgi:hypothetical protein
MGWNGPNIESVGAAFTKEEQLTVPVTASISVWMSRNYHPGGRRRQETPIPGHRNGQGALDRFGREEATIREEQCPDERISGNGHGRLKSDRFQKRADRGGNQRLPDGRHRNGKALLRDSERHRTIADIARELQINGRACGACRPERESDPEEFLSLLKVCSSAERLTLQVCQH